MTKMNNELVKNLSKNDLKDLNLDDLDRGDFTEDEWHGIIKKLSELKRIIEDELEMINRIDKLTELYKMIIDTRKEV